MQSLGDISRRSVLAAAAGSAWLGTIARALAADERLAESERRPATADSIILLWLAGGPSQLETFDPHPGTNIAAGTKAIDSRVPGLQLAAGFPLLAEQMDVASVVRSLVGKEGDHERAMYAAKTGYLPDAVTVHPAIGAVCCHQLAMGETEIPRHVSILPQSQPGRGGFLGAQYDAFQMGDPAGGVPDIKPRVEAARLERRVADWEFVEGRFARGRARPVDELAMRPTMTAARAMMQSPQLAAFDVQREPAAVLAKYGDTAFGRGCLAARRLVEVGVRCVEVTLGGWDSHANNHETHAGQAGVLDPALAALLADLRERGRLERTLVVCAGEFGRTPRLNGLDGRDHWTSGYSALVAGGGLRAGAVIGATDPEGNARVDDPRTMADLHATLYVALGIDPARENVSPAGRPIKLSEGRPIAALLDG